MATINVSLPSDGSTADVADYNTPITTIVNEINGALDNSNIAAAAGIAGSKLADAGITNAKLATGAGEPGGAWTSWTPTWTNLTISSSTVDCKYTQIGKTVIARGVITLAGSPVVGTNPCFSLPVAEHSGYLTSADMFNSIGTCALSDASANVYSPGFVDIGVTAGAGKGTLIAQNTASTYSSLTGLSSTIPFTWAAGDIITFSITYEAA